MKNVIEILDRYYQSFINQKRDWDFFLGVADYVKYAIETPETDNILKSIVQKRFDAEKRLKEYEQEAVKEAKEIKDKLFRKIKKSKISYDALNELMQEHQNQESGKILSSQSDAEALSGCLIDIIQNLRSNGYREITKDFIIEDKNHPEIITGYTCFKKLDAYNEEKSVYDNQKEIELWGTWGNLALVYIVIFKRKEELERLRKDKRNWWTAFNLRGLIGEMQKIKGQSAFSNSEPVWFIKDAYISYATRIHNYLIQELNLNIERNKLPKSPLQEEIDRRIEKAQFKKEIIEEIEGKKKTQDGKKPFCIVENNWGYLKFDKYGEKIKIGTPKSRHFRLLECLLEPFGKAKTIEVVFDWIKLLKDKKDSDLSGWDNYKKKNRQIVIIQNAIKELQKGNKLRKKLAFEFDDIKTKIWIKSLE